MSSTVIRVENLSKLYRLGEVGTGSLAHDINRWWHRLRGKEDPYSQVGQTNDRTKKAESDWVWALQDINFEVKEGEVLGIIGRNGTGKSTLLKILSRVTAPTSGDVKVRGRIASLLEVGTGFHPELTGRENIYLNGSILGMRKREIDQRLDEIVDFSGCEAYLDTPAKRYSSGMQVRLAFAVAAHLEPEILIVDEVLAVGDAEFQKKCLGKMKDVSMGGRTVLFVSHNIAAVQKLCTKCVLLEKGRLDAFGKASEITQLYRERVTTPATPSDRNRGDFSMRIEVRDAEKKPTSVWRYGERICIVVSICAQKTLWKPAVDIAFYDGQRQRLFTIQSDRLGSSPDVCLGRWSYCCEIENPGFTLAEITIDAGLRQGAANEYLVLQVDAARLTADFASLPESAGSDDMLYPRLTHHWEAKQ